MATSCGRLLSVMRDSALRSGGISRSCPGVSKPSGNLAFRAGRESWMKFAGGELRLAATDVSNHLACRHLTNLELGVARGEREAPEWRAPDLVVIQELGLRHEARYLAHLRGRG